MPKSLPSAPSLEHLKKQAKALQAAYRRRNPEATRLIREFHPDFSARSTDPTIESSFSLSDAQLVIARDYGFASWPKLKEYIDQQASPNRAAWVSAVINRDLGRMRALLTGDPALANSLHFELDDPYRQKRFPVATLLFASAGYPVQTAECAANPWPASLDMVKLLLESGADPNIYSLHGRPLCHVSDREIAQILVKNGADIDLWHHNGGSPLNFSVWKQEPDRTCMLLDLGANPNGAEPATGQTCLHYAGDGEAASECIRLLLEAGTDPNRRCSADPGESSYLVRRHFPEMPLVGETSLHLAALYGNRDRIGLLLNHGADRSIRTSTGETAGDWAKRAERPDEIVRILTV